MMNHTGTVTLETDRLILRRYEMSDAEDMYNNWVADPEVARFWQWEPHESIEETKGFLKLWIEEYKKPDNYLWTIVLKSISQAIGYIYLADVNDTENSVSVHYALSRKHWNRGIMPETCNRVLEFAFDVLGAERVYTHHHIDNGASGKVMQKCGMRHYKTAYREMPEYEQISGDYCYYEIVSADWKRKGVQP